MVNPECETKHSFFGQDVFFILALRPPLPLSGFLLATHIFWRACSRTLFFQPRLPHLAFGWCLPLIHCDDCCKARGGGEGQRSSAVCADFVETKTLFPKVLSGHFVPLLCNKFMLWFFSTPKYNIFLPPSIIHSSCFLPSPLSQQFFFAPDP